ncbi:MAG: MerR family transcriptional regulator [Stackebrandtia sp.]
MFTIGDFARLGRVSVRMLRHYDALGLLRPARVDAGTGYRHYEAAQLARLNRIIALKDLGLTLEQVATILHEQVGLAELRGMLRLRQAEVAAEIAAGQARLTGIKTRLAAIEAEGRLPDGEVVIKEVPAIRVAELTGLADGYRPGDIGPVIGPLFQRLCANLEKAGVEPAGPGTAFYEPNGDRITVHASFPVDIELGERDGFEVVVLPAIRAATVIHRGPMDLAELAEQRLAHWIDANGHRGAGFAREVNLECPPDEHQWVTEIQEPITD